MFWIFAGKSDRPVGGFDDWRGAYSDLPEAIKEAARLGDWWQVVDIDRAHVVAEGRASRPQAPAEPSDQRRAAVIANRESLQDWRRWRRRAERIHLARLMGSGAFKAYWWLMRDTGPDWPRGGR